MSLWSFFLLSLNSKKINRSQQTIFYLRDTSLSHNNCCHKISGLFHSKKKKSKRAYILKVLPSVAFFNFFSLGLILNSHSNQKETGWLPSVGGSSHTRKKYYKKKIKFLSMMDFIHQFHEVLFACSVTTNCTDRALYTFVQFCTRERKGQ